MTKEVYTQDDLPNFYKAWSEAREKGLDATQHLSRQYIRYAKMSQKCHNPKGIVLIHKQQQRIVDALGRTHDRQKV